MGDVILGEVGYCIVEGGWRWTEKMMGKKINWPRKLSEMPASSEKRFF